MQPAATNDLAALVVLDASFGGVGVLVDLPASVVDFLPVWILGAAFPLTIVVICTKTSVYLSAEVTVRLHRE